MANPPPNKNSPEELQGLEEKHNKHHTQELVFEGSFEKKKGQYRRLFQKKQV